MEQTDGAGGVELQKDPVVHEDVWESIKSVTNAKQFAAVFRLTEDESEIIPETSFDWADGGLWPKLLAHFSPLDQDIRWAVVNLPYTTDSGGKRNKVVFITWVPDTLTRKSMRESVRVKFNGVQFGTPMRKQASKSGASLYQANDLDDLTLDSVLSKVTRFERDEINKESLAMLR
ncbi:uncharacterized protein LOC135823675 [Sycon ciliatum]|uniref:uncharacterized protein LOC135823675 n=1 Tax=Sycon ciliatum TaxID=27933 RepID=UPI0020A95A7E|eukprot:scpid66190/ scgid31229/ 